MVVKRGRRLYILLFLALTLSLLGLHVRAQGGACTDAIVNGDFEGDGGWTEYSKVNAELISSFPPPSGAYHSGNRGAYLGDYNNAHDYIAQQVTIPADALSATLRYYGQVETEEISALARDTMTVTLDSPLGTPVATLRSYSNTDAEAVWHEAVVDVSTYRGQTLVLRFDVRTDESLPTAFYLDDVSLTVCEPEATATPTPTSTPTPRPSFRNYMPWVLR